MSNTNTPSNHKHNPLTLLAAACALLLIGTTLLACRSQVDPYELDLTWEGYSQGANEARDQGDYKLAIRYYEAFKDKHPEDLYGNLWASYEIAFCTYKMKKYDAAEEMLVDLLNRYERLAEREDLQEGEAPAGPRILAEKVLEKVREKTTPAQPPVTTGQPGQAGQPVPSP